MVGVQISKGEMHVQCMRDLLLTKLTWSKENDKDVGYVCGL